VIGQTISHYKVLSRLGAGGMGVVYEDEDIRLGRRVAIKFLPDDTAVQPEAVQRFLREARVIATLNHPHICTLHDIGEHDPSAGSGQGGQQFMVMELLEGESLKTRIARGALPIDDVTDLGTQLADALDAAHAKGIVHRDIKPPNLFVTPRGQLKVLDFGVAKLNQARAGDRESGSTIGAADQLTTMGTTIGTVSYMSPEQARGQEIDGRSDVFSAGVVLYEMATRQLPFTGATVATIFEGTLTKPHVPPSQLVAGIPAEFDRIVGKALEKDRETRYQSAAEMRADLKRLRTAPTSAAASAPVPKASPAGRKWALIGTPLLMVALVGGFFAYRSVTTPALTEKDTVVLSAVVNRTGDPMFDDTLGEALGVQLRQSPFLKVVPDQQVQATLRLMGRDPMTPITAEVGRDLCQRTGAKALLGGSIAMLGTAYVVTLNAQDCVTGSILAEQQAQADSKETVLKTLGGAVSTLREQLGESLASVQRYDAKIEEATTPSLEALKAYSMGLRTRRTSGDFDAVPFFKRAIDLDPEFAIAYARLGTVYSNLNQGDEGRKMTTRAFELREKVSEAERLYIEARYYTTVKPDLEKAIETYRLTLATYPNDYTALTNSALLLNQQGNQPEALRNLEQAVRVAPDQPLAWQNLASTYLQAQRVADARNAAESSLKVQDSLSARSTLYQIGVVTGDQALADQQVAAMRGRRDEVDFLIGRAQGSMYLGQMEEAALLATEWQARMEQASRVGRTGEAMMNLAINEALVGLTDAARKRMDDLGDRDLLTPATLDEQLVLAAVLQDAALAQSVLPGAIAEAKKGSSEVAAAKTERVLRAIDAIAGSKPAEAATLLEPVTFDLVNRQQVSIWSIAQLQAGHWAEAAKGFAWLETAESVNSFNASPAFSLASLARAQVQLGQPAEARKTYEKLFKFWKDADANLPLLVKAREEFAKLS
jgi:serine/threonine protein kinase/tetratricopeptide (TPR) repeat protein